MKLPRRFASAALLLALACTAELRAQEQEPAAPTGNAAPSEADQQPPGPEKEQPNQTGGGGFTALLSEDASATVRLFVQDALGQSLAQSAIIYKESDADLEKPIAKSTSPEVPVSLAPGRYWVVSASDESLGQLVTLAAGESKDVKVKLDRGLWLSFNAGKDKPPDKVLLVLRPKAELEQWFYWSRMGGNTYDFSARRPEATDEALEAAHKAALAPPVWTEQTYAPATMMNQEERRLWYSRRNIELQAARRILGITGNLEDVDTLLKLATADMDTGQRDKLAFLIGLIEARHDALEKGRLMAMVRDKDSDWAFPAAKALNRFGLAVGREVLRGNMVAPQKTWGELGAAHWLNADSSPATLGAMREFFQAELDAHESAWALMSTCLHLLTYGEREDWKRVASVAFEKGGQANELACLAQDPRGLLTYSLGSSSLESAAATLPKMRDRGAKEFASLRDWLNDAMAEYSRKAEKNANTALNTAVVLESGYFPDADAVRFYYGFNKEKISGMMAGPGDIAANLTWFPYPELVDLFVKEWLVGETRYLPQLDYVPLDKIEDAVKRLGEGRVPPGYELYRAYHRIAHRQRFVEDPLPMGERRWPYVVAYRERNESGGEEFGGGISGVASLKAEWRDKTLLLRVKLDQRAHYEGGGALFGVGDRGNVKEYPHHRYMVENGRALIDSVVVRRGSRRFPVADTKRADGKWLVFEAAMDDPSLADLWVDINLKFIDQSITLTESLFAGAPANLMRQVRYEATNSKEQKPASTEGKP